MMSTSIANPAGIRLIAVPSIHVNLHTPKNPFSSKVVHKSRITHPSSPHFGWHVVLSLEGSRMAGKYRNGQSIGVVPEGRFYDANFNYAHRLLDRKIRLYSIASPCWGDDLKGETVSLCAKRGISEDKHNGGTRVW